MKDKTRLLLMKIFGVFLVAGIIAFLGYVFLVEGREGLSPISLIWLLVPAVMVILILILTLKRISSGVKSGLPLDDEMSRRIKDRAGYLSFLATLWFMIGMMWYHSFMEELNLPVILARHIVIIVLIFSLAAFGVAWLILSRRGLK